MSTKRIIYVMALALLSSAFLSAGMIVNSLNAFNGASWAWTAALRYLLALPVLFIIVTFRGGLKSLMIVIKKIPLTFIIWGCLGFGIYYALLSYGVSIAPGWLVTAAFMTTVLAGIILAPLIYDDHRAQVSKKAVILSLALVLSLALMQLDRIKNIENVGLALASAAMAVVAAFLWPLGNRKMLLKLEKAEIVLDPMQRVLGMSIGSIPILLVLSVYGFCSSGMPTTTQLETSFLAVLLAGVIGSVLFFKAMQLAGKDYFTLLTVEALQATSVLFTLFGEMVFKHSAWPGFYGTIGFIFMGLILAAYGYISFKANRNLPWRGAFGKV